jgi:hypothetical protein
MMRGGAPNHCHAGGVSSAWLGVRSGACARCTPCMQRCVASVADNRHASSGRLEHRSSMGAVEASSACLLLCDDTVKCLVHPDDASGGTYARHCARAQGSLYAVVFSRQKHSVSDVRGQVIWIRRELYQHRMQRSRRVAERACPTETTGVPPAQERACALWEVSAPVWATA